MAQETDDEFAERITEIVHELAEAFEARDVYSRQAHFGADMYIEGYLSDIMAVIQDYRSEIEELDGTTY